MINQANINSLWASLIVEELIRLGHDQFCISPGSRSTPLVLAVAEHEKAKVIFHFDERGAAFYALGQARGSGQPAVLICTSGTAVANYLPAVVEATNAMVPMIILSADRPTRLRRTGANQTIDQVELFGKYPRYFHDLESPTTETKPTDLLSLIDEATRLATSPEPGVVHFNCIFDEPLAPIDDGVDYSLYLKDLSGWLNSSEPYTEPTSILRLNKDEVERLAAKIRQHHQGLIVIGQLPESSSKKNIVKLANDLGWPVLCDITSGLKSSSEILNRINYYDQILLAEPESDLLQSDCLLHFGGSVVSKRLLSFLNDFRPKKYIQIKAGDLPFDPNRQVTDRVSFDPETVAQKLIGRLKQTPVSERETQKLDSQLDDLFSEFLNSRSPLTEPTAARLISASLPESHALFLSSSMTIRQFDMYSRFNRPNVIIGSNRGASGIDGTLATASGFAAGLNRPVTVVIGDLAMLHDLNSLALIRQSVQPITIVIFNNNGGRIFEQLPVAEIAKQFERCFVTPTDIRFQEAAKMFGLGYFKVESASQLLERYLTVAQFPKATILELDIIPQMSRRERVRLDEAVRALGNRND